MNWNPETMVNHYTTGQMLFQWLVVVPLTGLLLVYFMATVESFTTLVMTIFGYNNESRLTPRTTLMCATVIPIAVLVFQAITLVVLVSMMCKPSKWGT